MKSRKINIFKIITVCIMILFLIQCTTTRRGKWISSYEKIDLEKIPEFIYRIEKIKEPTKEDPVMEYKLVKFPVHLYWSITEFEKISIDHTKKNWLCVLGGIAVGGIAGIATKNNAEFFSPTAHVIGCSLVGGIYGAIAAIFFKGKSSVIPDETIEVRKQIDRPNMNQPYPVSDYPIDLIIFVENKTKIIKIKSDTNGIIRIDPARDLLIHDNFISTQTIFTLSYSVGTKQNSITDKYILPK